MKFSPAVRASTDNVIVKSARTDTTGELELDPLQSVLDDVRAGRPIVLVDDSDRENEGDITLAAELISQEAISFMMNEGKGLICISLTEERCEELGLPRQTRENSSSFGTNFLVSFDLRDVAAEGVTAASRARSIRAAVDPSTKASDLVLPGFVFPVCAVPGGVLKRRGQTEGSVDLARLAGLNPAGVICEVMGEDGQMLRGAKLSEFCKQHGLKIASVEQITQFRLRNEIAVRRVAELTLSDGAVPRRVRDKLSAGTAQQVRIVVYVDDVDNEEHLAVIIGEPKAGALTRIHSECLTGDIFGSRRCDCGPQLDRALELFIEDGAGVLVYLHQEGRGIGLGNKLRAYDLQDGGLDTVDANLHLGFEVDNRSYRVGAHILQDQGLREVRLLTNNPQKVSSLTEYGLKVVERVSLTTKIDEFNRRYLEAKRDRLGHMLS